MAKTLTTFTGSVSSANINGNSITNIAGPGSHSHTISAHTHTSASMNMTQQFVHFHQSSNVGPQEGDMRMNMGIGALECYTNNAWTVIAGKDEKTQVDLIRDQLKEFWPEVLFDLIMKDLL